MHKNPAADDLRVFAAVSAEGFRVLAYALPRGSAAGYMPELNVLIGLADYSTQSDQPLMKNVKVRVTASRTG